jgi:Tol biopolymer transport system component
VYATPSASFCTSFGYEARGRMAWSPDGANLVFPTSRGCHENPFELFIARADGSTAATGLVTPTAGLESAFPAWSPDGKQIAFLGSETPDSTGVYVADVGPSGALPGGLQARHIGSDTAVTLGFALSGPQWSPDGTSLAVTNGIFDDTTKTSGIVVMKPDGSGERVIAQDAGHPSWSPIWSPNGRQLAYFRAVDPTEYFNGRPCTVRAWVIDADGTNERRLDPLAEGCDMAPAWSPDGTRLSVLLIKTGDLNPWQMSVMMLDGSESLVTLGDGAVGSWQPVAAPLPPAPSFGATEPSL